MASSFAAAMVTFSWRNVWNVGCAIKPCRDVAMERGATSESVTVTTESTLLHTDTRTKTSNTLPQQIQGTLFRAAQTRTAPDSLHASTPCRRPATNTELTARSSPMREHYDH